MCSKERRQSRGELKIAQYLDMKGVTYKREKPQNDGISTLFFDFKTSFGAIEFDGEQHFRAIDFFGGKEKYVDNYERDKRKNFYCKQHKIPLLRIRYDQIEEVEAILEHFINNPSWYLERCNPYLTNVEYYSIRENIGIVPTKVHELGTMH